MASGLKSLKIHTIAIVDTLNGMKWFIKEKQATPSSPK